MSTFKLKHTIKDMVLRIFEKTDSEGHLQLSKLIVWLTIASIRSVTPLAFLTLPTLLISYVFSLFGIRELSTLSHFGIVAIGIWCLLEIEFYFRCTQLKQKFDPPINFGGYGSPLERKVMLERYLDQCPNPWDSLTKWFVNHESEDIGSESMQEWITWAFFGKSCNRLTEAEHEEVKGFMREIIKKCPRIYRPSAKKPLKFMRPGFDDLKVQLKPWILVMGIRVYQICSERILRWMGFQRHTLRRTRTLSYYSYRSTPPNQQFQQHSKTPIFFVHGIGGGLGAYLYVLRTILKADPERPVYLLDMPHMSLKILNNVPTMEETVEAVDEIFARHRLKNCSWLAHSYGTIVTAWVVKERPKYVRRLTFVDPILFTLWESDMAYNFLYRNPSNPMYKIIQFLVARDLVVAYTLTRHFWWSQNILFPQDITCPANIYLSSHDFVIDCEKTYSYLVKNRVNNVGENNNGRNLFGIQTSFPLEVFKMEGMSHGHFAYSPKHLNEIVRQL